MVWQFGMNDNLKCFNLIGRFLRWVRPSNGGIWLVDWFLYQQYMIIKGLIQHSFASNFQKVNMSGKIKCLFCPRQYFQQQHCNRHMLKEHQYSKERAGNVQCVLCPNRYKNQKYCDHHMKAKHGYDAAAERRKVREELFLHKSQRIVFQANNILRLKNVFLLSKLQ